ncbi:MAG TPA: hypothetical protein VKX39_02625 [Bryobacteraceae bacterium]|jgi:hypothetical protein|nr:hypothetical protein [Bryobacteraceae bacterium]
MRTILPVFAVLLAGAGLAQAPTYELIGSVSQVMIRIIYPTSDALFYIERAPPKTEVEWNAIRNQALTLAESGNLLMLPGRAPDQGNWIKDTKMMMAAARAAYKAALAKDMAGILAQSDALTESCVACHRQYRPDYGKK